MNFPPDNTWIAIAAAEPDARHDEDTGLPGDFIVYPAALSEGRVKYIAADGTGIFTVRSVANPYGNEDLGDRAVNLRDFAKLTNNWLMKEAMASVISCLRRCESSGSIHIV